MQKTIYRPTLTEARAKELARMEARKIQKFANGTLGAYHYQKLNYYNGIIQFYNLKHRAI